MQVNRTGVRSIALGTGRSGLLSLPYLPQNSDVIVGDLLVSSGLGGVYPPGYPVGKVTAITRDPGQPLLAVEAAPLAGLDRDPEILLVWFDSAVVEPETQAEAKPAASTPPAKQPSQSRRRSRRPRRHHRQRRKARRKRRQRHRPPRRTRRPRPRPAPAPAGTSPQPEPEPQQPPPGNAP